MDETIFQKNVPLKNYTTFKIGGPAQYFFIAKSKEDLQKAVKIAKEEKLPIFIFGGGSNILVSDKGIKGLVIKMQNNSPKAEGNLIFAGAGLMLPEVCQLALENNLSGIEWAFGVPGTLGGAIYGNAQAFGTKISDAVKSIEALDLKSLEIKNFSKEQCNFSLKSSVFKKNKNLVIVSAVLQLKPDNAESIKEKMDEFLAYRKKGHPLEYPSAGSMFVNPEVVIKDAKLLEKFPELLEFNKKGVIPSGYLIQKCGLSGKKIGGAQISEKHANFIINLGQAKAKDVISLINLVKKQVKNTFGINLEAEVQSIGI